MAVEFAVRGPLTAGRFELKTTADYAVTAARAFYRRSPYVAPGPELATAGQPVVAVSPGRGRDQVRLDLASLGARDADPIYLEDIVVVHVEVESTRPAPGETLDDGASLRFTSASGQRREIRLHETELP